MADGTIVCSRITRSASRKKLEDQHEHQQREVKKQKKSLVNDNDVHVDVVSRKMSPPPFKPELGSSSSEYHQWLKKQKKKKKKNTPAPTLESLLKGRRLTWEDFIPMLGGDKFPEEDNPNFYRKMIRLTYDLPSKEDDNVRQFQLEQQHLKQPKCRPFTKNERNKYMEKLQSSEGFDVLDVPDHITDLGLIRPQPYFEEDSRIFQQVKNCSKLALHFYNKQHKEENYQFVKVLKVNFSSSAGSIYYITFEAKPMDPDAPPDNFQACVYAGIVETKVFFCRPELKSSSS